MSSELCSAKMRHAIDAGEGGTPTLAVMSIQLLLREDISTRLRCSWISICSDAFPSGRGSHTSQEKETIVVFEQQRRYRGRIRSC